MQAGDTGANPKRSHARTTLWAIVALVAGVCCANAASAQLLGGGRDTVQLEIFRDCAYCPEMVILPPGTMGMGADELDLDAEDSEQPVHQVTIDYRFAIGVTEITFAQWDACVAFGGCSHRANDLDWGRGAMPAIDLSWNDAVEYVVWLSGVTGAPYRLPSEAEWEYAARAGADGAHYWAGGIDRGCAFANLADQAALQRFPEWEAAACNDGFAVNAPVGQLRANDFGLHDVLGNVWEWTEDCWNPTYRGAPNDGSAWLAGDCRKRVLRGGAATGLPQEVRLSQRGTNNPDVRAAYNGLRVVITVDDD